MKAGVFDEGKINIREVLNPKLTEKSVLIKVKAVGICGTDIAIVKRDLPVEAPLILGHEFTGEIVQIGNLVDKSLMGKRVTSEINDNIDFNCYYCQREVYTQCISRKAIGIDIDGALAEYIAVNSFLIHEIPDIISYQEATFIEPLAAAYQTFEMMPFSEDDKTVAIFGLGKLGLLITQIALSKNLKVIAVDGSEMKLNLAKNYGVSHVINRHQIKDIPEKVKELTNSKYVSL